MTEEKTKFKKCPSCSGYIPAHWDHHDKCGWNANGEAPKEPQQATLNKFRTPDELTRRDALEFATYLYGGMKKDLKKAAKLIKKTTEEYAHYIKTGEWKNGT